jgi:hypothetical protein
MLRKNYGGRGQSGEILSTLNQSAKRAYTKSTSYSFHVLFLACPPCKDDIESFTLSSMSVGMLNTDTVDILYSLDRNSYGYQKK